MRRRTLAKAPCRNAQSDMESLIKKLIFLCRQGPFVIFLICGVLVLCLAMLLGMPLLLLFLVALVPSIYYVIAPLLSVRPKLLAEVADDYIKNIKNDTSREFCLILRPFGVDGDTIIPTRGWNNFLSKQMDRFTPLKIPKTVEQIIVKAVKELFNCETVALVDPNVRVMSNSPRYIAAENDRWQLTIDLLLRRTLVAFLILHPQKQLTGSVWWEVDCIVRLGLAHRFVIVLPPPDRIEYEGAYEALQQLREIFPGLLQVPFGAFVVLACSCESVRYWFHLHPNGDEEVSEATYLSALKQCLMTVKNEVLYGPHSQKYRHWNKRIRSIKLDY